MTRDKDLLSLGSYEGIRMVTPRQFLDLLGGAARVAGADVIELGARPG